MKTMCPPQALFLYIYINIIYIYIYIYIYIVTSEITNKVSANGTGNKKKPKTGCQKLFKTKKKVSYFLSKYETFSNTKKFVLFSTLACLILERRGGKVAGWGWVNKMHQERRGGGVELSRFYKVGGYI